MKCPKCEKDLVLRKNSKTGLSFWGCSGFPVCKFSADTLETKLNKANAYSGWEHCDDYEGVYFGSLNPF